MLRLSNKKKSIFIQFFYCIKNTTTTKKEQEQKIGEEITMSAILLLLLLFFPFAIPPLMMLPVSDLRVCTTSSCIYRNNIKITINSNINMLQVSTFFRFFIEYTTSLQTLKQAQEEAKCTSFYYYCYIIISMHKKSQRRQKNGTRKKNTIHASSSFSRRSCSCNKAH